jgi:hypothetical protein
MLLVSYNVQQRGHEHVGCYVSLFGLEGEFNVLEVLRVDSANLKVLNEQTAREAPAQPRLPVIDLAWQFEPSCRPTAAGRNRLSLATPWSQPPASRAQTRNLHVAFDGVFARHV